MCEVICSDRAKGLERKPFHEGLFHAGNRVAPPLPALRSNLIRECLNLFYAEMYVQAWARDELRFRDRSGIYRVFYYLAGAGTIWLLYALYEEDSKDITSRY